MESIKPQSNFPIVRGLPDHTDSGTYYVQAIIRNAKDDTLIDTVNLIDKGNRYFSKNWTTPADVSGEGFYISIVTSVYTDASYTTKADMYGDEFQTYLVAERPNNAQILGGGGGGSDISYKKIREIVTEIVAEAFKGLPQPQEQKELDLTPLESKLLAEVRIAISKIDGLKFPDQEKFDYARIIGALGHTSKSIMDRIDGINIPEFDYNLLEERFDFIRELFANSFTKFETDYKAIKDDNLKDVTDIKNKFKVLNKIKNLLDESGKEEEEEPIKPEIKKPWYKVGKEIKENKE